jgi:glycosyltransferase involved in cell wall biosynthesis
VPSVNVLIPAFNEEAAIALQIRELEDVLGTSGWTWDLLVVDDGSTDATATRAEACRTRVLRLGRNRGYGAALKAGIDATRHEWILIIDADGTYPAGAMPDLLREAPSADMIVGARVTARMHTPVLRRPAKWILRAYAGLLARQRIPDLNSGMRLIRRASIPPFRYLLPSGFSFTSTITLALAATGQRIRYVPIDYLARVGNSKIRASDFFRMFGQITRVMAHFFPWRVVSLWGVALWPAGAMLLWTLGPVPAVVASATLCGLCAVLAGAWMDRQARLERARQS